MVVDLVLSGGGSKFPAHVGVLKALHELNMPVRTLWGTSAGALVGGLFKCGSALDYLEELALRFNLGDFLPGTWWRKLRVVWYGHMSDGEDLLDLLLAETRGLTMAEAPGFRALATDLATDGHHVFSADSDPALPVALAIRASLSLPWIFQAVPWNGHLYADGGLHKNFAIDMAAEQATDKLIVGALITSPPLLFTESPGFIDWQRVTIDRLMRANVQESLDDLSFQCHCEPFNYTVVELNQVELSWFDFDLDQVTKQALIDNAYHATLKALNPKELT